MRYADMSVFPPVSSQTEKDPPAPSATAGGRLKQLHWWCGAGCFVLFVALLFIQLLVPPYLGMADNGDFAKVARRFSLLPADPSSKYYYFDPDYIFSRGAHWESDARSSEQWPANVAFYLSGVKNEGDRFNIRWIGAVHASILTLAFTLFLQATRKLTTWASMIVRIAVIWIFTDVLYVSYLNSFYSDTAALLGLLGCVAVATRIVVTGPQFPLVLGFTVYAILLIASKGQHASWGFLPAMFLFLSTRWEKRLWIRRLDAAAGILLLITMAVALWMTPTHYKGEARFNLIFRKVAKMAPDPRKALLELGLSKSDSRYIGLSAYRAESPVSDERWFADFCRRTSYSRVAEYYFHHPIQACQILRADLDTRAPYILWYVAVRRQDARTPGQWPQRFASWTHLRIALWLWWPSHILVWYSLLAVGIILILRARASPVAVRLAWLTAGLAAAAAAEYCISSLGDSEETARHLFLFHSLTDVTICLAITALVSDTLRASLNKLIVPCP